MAQISIEGMEFFAHHGCMKEEQIIGTRFMVDFHCETDTHEAQRTDDLSKTVNYQTVYGLIKGEMGVKSKLLEHVANRILHRICGHFPQIRKATVKVCKLNPPVGGKTEKVCITLTIEDLSE
jgi:dihydroneopterin aldolase